MRADLAETWRATRFNAHALGRKVLIVVVPEGTAEGDTVVIAGGDTVQSDELSEALSYAAGIVDALWYAKK